MSGAAALNNVRRLIAAQNYPSAVTHLKEALGSLDADASTELKLKLRLPETTNFKHDI